MLVPLAPARSEVIPDQDRESQEYVDDEHSYYPLGPPQPHWRRTLPTVTSPRYDRGAELDIPV
jgi:hypothetical protein